MKSVSLGVKYFTTATAKDTASATATTTDIATATTTSTDTATTTTAAAVTTCIVYEKCDYGGRVLH